MGDSGRGDAPAANEVDDLVHLRRLLCFGNELGRCLVEDQKLSQQSASCIKRLIETERGEEAVREIEKFSTEGRVANQRCLVFSLAMCTRLASDVKREHHVRTKRAAYAAVPSVCRTPTDLFRYVVACKSISDKNGSLWGRGSRKALSKWYLDKDPKRLAYLVTKYISREGWSHKDLLRLLHISTENEATNAVLRYVTRGLKATRETYDNEKATDDVKQVLRYLEAVSSLKHSEDPQHAAALIREHKLVREHIPTSLFRNKEVWSALLDHMPITALLRNLSRLSALGLCAHDSRELDIVLAKLRDAEAFKAARVHPVNLLLSWQAYNRGRSEHKTKIVWTPSVEVCSALSNAFHDCFSNVTPTNKRFLVAVDCTKPMHHGAVLGCKQLCPLVAAAAMLMMTSRVEPNCDVINFAKQPKLVDIKQTMDLEEVKTKLKEMPTGNADCALPITWALQEKRGYDVIMLLTDCTPISGAAKPSDALKLYRDKLKLPSAKLVVCALTATNLSVADPADRFMLDVSGLDANTPLLMQQFVNEEV